MARQSYRMMRFIVLTISIFGLIYCSTRSQKDNSALRLLSKGENRHFKKVKLFNDSNYIFTLTTIDTTGSYKIKKTAVVNLFHVHADKIDTLISDSLFCRNPMAADQELKIRFIDFDFDGTDDLILPRGADPRGNLGFHLYLTNTASRRIKYVTGFEEIGNPKADYKNRIIRSIIVAGPSFLKFYAFDENKEIKDLGHQVNITFSKNDSLEIQKALADINKERRSN